MAHTKPDTVNQIADFLVLTIIFYLSCLMLSPGGSSILVLQALVYASTVLLSVSLCRRLMIRSNCPLSGMTRLIACNATGITAATLAMVPVGRALPGGGDYTIALMFSSVMAFFVLGTLLPLQYKKTSSA